jgi:signal transduction histidine kinase
MTPIINSLIKEQEYKINRNAIDVILEIKTGSTKILTDEYAFQQIFSNLLDNAIKNTQKGRISVNISAPNKEWIEIRVTDNGKGISKGFQKDIFKPFSRDRVNGPGVHGLGLGLTLTREFCKLLNADIELKSEAGKGTEVLVSLPAVN